MLRLPNLVQQLKGTLVTAAGKPVVSGISIDTRTLKPGECFIAIRGSHLDGHSFLLEADRRGASAFVVDTVFMTQLVENTNQVYVKHIQKLPNLIAVEDTVRSLGFVAAHKRNVSQAACIGITGSCGKTTTKEFVRLVLEEKGAVASGSGNLNNHIGLPLSLLACDTQADFLVYEMGASRMGDIGYLAQLLRPEVGIITNVYPVHLEGLRKLENVYKTKLELAEYLDTVSGTVIVNGDDEKLVREVRKYNINMITFGKQPSCDIALSRVEYADGIIHFEVNSKYPFTLNTLAYFNVFNALAALAVGDVYGLQLAELSRVFLKQPAMNGRLRIHRGEYIVIDDTYNANPHSFMEVLAILQHMKTRKRKIVVCGDMLELGEASERFHQQLAADILAAGTDIVIAVGELTRVTCETITKAKPAVRCIHCDNNQGAISVLQEEIEKGDIVLIKGSRCWKLEEVVRAL